MRISSFDANARLTHATSSLTAAPAAGPAAKRTFPHSDHEVTRSYLRLDRPAPRSRRTHEREPGPVSHMNPRLRDLQEQTR